MPSNRLAGSGPMPSTPGAGDGPSPGLSGTLGAVPQAPSQTSSNMLSGAQPQAGMPRPGQPQQPIVPPSPEMLMEALHKQSYVTSALKGLLGKPNLSDRDVINAVGETVADGIMSPFQAADYLKDLPADAEPLQLRQWVGQHYANASQALQTVAEMLHAHGAMTRRGGMPMAPQAAPIAPQNALSGSQTLQ